MEKRKNLFNLLMDKTGISPLGLLSFLVLFILPIVPPFDKEYMIRWLITCAFLGTLAMAFDFTGGFINIVNFGFCAIMGLGGYTSALLVNNLGTPIWLGMMVGAFSAGVSGFIIGIISLRLRGIFAACLAWFYGMALMGLTVKMVWLTRGPLGLRAPLMFPEMTTYLPYYYVAIIILVLTYILFRRILNSKFGLAFKLIGQNLEAARTSGVNPVFYRVTNFTISSCIAGFLGGFYAHYYGVLTPDLLHTSKTIEVLAIAYIGGRGSLWGGAVAAFPFVIGTEFLRVSLSNMPGVNMMVYGLLIMLVMIYYPDGIAHFFRKHLAESQFKILRWLSIGKV